MYNQFIQNLQAQRLSLIEQIQHIDAVLKLNGVEINEVTSSVEDTKNCPYKKSDTYQAKFASILKQTNRFLSINELANIIHDYEPKVSFEDAKKGLGSAKNLLLKSGTIVKYQEGTNNSNSFYGASYWIGENGKPKQEHMFDEAVLQTKQTISI